MWIQFLVQEDPLEESITTHSSILVWRIPMDRGAWRAIVHRVAQSQTRLKRLSTHARTHMTMVIVIKDREGFLTEKGLPIKEVLPRTEGVSRDVYGHCSQITDKLSYQLISSLISFSINYFNCKVITKQYHDGFCHTST